MRKIPEEIRQSIRDLYAQGGLTYDQVAEQLGVAKNCVVDSLVTKRTKTLADRFWEKVDVRGPDECWLWAASIKDCGYGQIYVNELGRSVAASRVSWFLAYGEWPLECCHKCDVRRCVNVAHLFNGDRAANMQDCRNKGRLKIPSVKRGITNPRGKLTEDDVFHIRTLYHLCKPQDLAAAFGVSRGHIVNVYNRRDRKFDP